MDVLAANPSLTILATVSGMRISLRNRSSCSSSRARRVGPGYLRKKVVSRTGYACQDEAALHQISQVFGLAEVLQIFQVRNEVFVVEQLLCSEVLKIEWV